tara:strand:+ start:119 stop:1042 length:924 start_codon:yes stop_codon:yes gene_type:complete
MPKERGGKPDTWSRDLWDAYKIFGESDAKYVESCNRFLMEMCEHQLGPIAELNLKLMTIMIRNGDIPMPDHFDITTGLPSLLDLGDAEDEVDIYRNWYMEHIRWPEECVVGKETLEVGSMPYEVFSPWLLTACRERAIRSVQGHLSTEIDIYVSDLGELILRASEDVLAYLKSGAWRIDEAPEDGGIESLDVQAYRGPEESRKEYINRVQEMVDTYLMYGMLQEDTIRKHPVVPLQGRPLDPDHLHEKMLCMRMFGATNSDIVDACEEALLDSKGRPLSDPRKTVYDRTNLIAKHLGFVPISGDEEA